MPRKELIESLLVVGLCGALGGCVGLQYLQYQHEITHAIAQYQDAEHKVKIGDKMEEVLAILQPTQENLSAELKRTPEHWIDPKSEKVVDLYYFRSGWIPDGRLTDEELTPYLFIDDTLVAVGWNALRNLVGPPQSSRLERNSHFNSLENQANPKSDLLISPEGKIFLAPITPNAYGPGINSDATGRPFTYQPDFGGTGFPDPTLKVKPNAYGPGVGMDQYGRPVRPRSWP